MTVQTNQFKKSCGEKQYPARTVRPVSGKTVVMPVLMLMVLFTMSVFSGCGNKIKVGSKKTVEAYVYDLTQKEDGKFRYTFLSEKDGEKLLYLYGSETPVSPVYKKAELTLEYMSIKFGDYKEEYWEPIEVKWDETSGEWEKEE